MSMSRVKYHFLLRELKLSAFKLSVSMALIGFPEHAPAQHGNTTERQGRHAFGIKFILGGVDALQ